MTPLKHSHLAHMTFPEAEGHLVLVERVEDLTGQVPHAESGRAIKYRYTLPKMVPPIYVYVLECSLHTYHTDLVDVWHFAEDFTAEEATAFLRSYRAAKLVPKKEQDAAT